MNKFYKKVLKIFILISICLVIGSGTAYAVFDKMKTDFDNLSAEEMHDLIANQRSRAIAKAQDTGDYKCCIQPPCTMCYDSANQWNYSQAGKCFCDEFIARGEEPCPQCKKGICNSYHDNVPGQAFCNEKS